jgi:hypothetical protein
MVLRSENTDFLGGRRDGTVPGQLELQYARIVHRLTVVNFHVVAFLNGFRKIPVVVSDKCAARFVIENQHELVHVHNLTLNVNIAHTISDFVNSHRSSLSTRFRSEELLDTDVGARQSAVSVLPSSLDCPRGASTRKRSSSCHHRKPCSFTAPKGTPLCNLLGFGSGIVFFWEKGVLLAFAWKKTGPAQSDSGVDGLV